jgi:hypothetical protein
MFFNLWALLFFILGIIIGIPAYVRYFQTGLVEKFPSLIVSCFGILMALLFWVAGIILEVIVKKQKQNYELYLNLLHKNK